MGLNAQAHTIFREFGEIQPDAVAIADRVGFKKLPDTLIVVIKRESEVRAPLFCEIINDTDEDLTLTVKQSSDNGAADAYAAINMRYGGADVASITLVPGGNAIFTIETQTEDYIRFDKSVAKNTGRIWIMDASGNFEDMKFTEEP